MPKSSHSELVPRNHVFTSSRGWLSWAAKIIIVLQGVFWITSQVLDYVASFPHNWIHGNYINPHVCRPALPQLASDMSPTDPIFREASKSLDRFLRVRVSQADIDSLAMAVVMPSGVVFQKGYGVLKANETDPEKRGLVDEKSIYRIASITKMFNTLETLILRDKGALNWDDPVTKFVSNFSYNPSSWPEYLSQRNGQLAEGREPITIRQLASHMSGIRRDYPLMDIAKCPALIYPLSCSKEKYFSIPGNDTMPTRDGILEVLKEQPLITSPYSYPIYSNTGFDLLGWVNVEANAAFGNRSQEPSTFAELLSRDVFERIGMNSSSFTIAPEMGKYIAVAAHDSWDTDLDFTDAFNPSGGQYSSLFDMNLFMQTLLNPHRENSVLSSYTVREWLRPLHGWSDDLTEVGAPWEISKYPDSFGRRQRFYQKGGNLVSHHSNFAINPVSAYGVIVLVAGRYSNTARLSYEAIRLFQPVFDKIQQHAAKEAYAGEWSSETGENFHATIRVRSGSLWIDKLVLNDTDVLALLGDRKPGKSKPLAFWNVGPERPREFRIAYGRPELNDDPIAGCEPYWVTIDGLSAHGVPIDLLYFDETRSDGVRVLRIPSARVTMTRVSLA